MKRIEEERKGRGKQMEERRNMWKGEGGEGKGSKAKKEERRDEGRGKEERGEEKKEK